jgi:hypothetical protein
VSKLEEVPGALFEVLVLAQKAKNEQIEKLVDQIITTIFQDPESLAKLSKNEFSA